MDSSGSLWCKTNARTATPQPYTLASALLNKGSAEPLMTDRQLHGDEAYPSRGELDQLNFDHHREERHRLISKSRTHHGRRSSDDRADRNTILDGTTFPELVERGFR